MNRRAFLALLVFTFLTALEMSTVWQESAVAFFGHRIGAGAQRTVVVVGTWKDAEPVTGLEPRTLWIRGRTIVTWINDSQADIIMKFGEGQECKKATSKSIGWRLKWRKCLVTRDPEPPKGTIRIRFDDSGRYSYEVIYVGKDRSEMGVVEVRGAY